MGRKSAVQLNNYQGRNEKALKFQQAFAEGKTHRKAKPFNASQYQALDFYQIVLLNVEPVNDIPSQNTSYTRRSKSKLNLHSEINENVKIFFMLTLVLAALIDTVQGDMHLKSSKAKSSPDESSTSLIKRPSHPLVEESFIPQVFSTTKAALSAFFTRPTHFSQSLTSISTKKLFPSLQQFLSKELGLFTTLSTAKPAVNKACAPFEARQNYINHFGENNLAAYMVGQSLLDLTNLRLKQNNKHLQVSPNQNKLNIDSLGDYIKKAIVRLNSKTTIEPSQQDLLKMIELYKHLQANCCSSPFKSALYKEILEFNLDVCRKAYLISTERTSYQDMPSRKNLLAMQGVMLEKLADIREAAQSVSLK